MKIFIIEDEPAIREELVQLLQKYGYQCDSSDDFHHIVQAALSSGANLILLDINLPYQDGFQVCREIRQKSNLPIIVLTSRNSDFDELMSLNIGADDYIAKPYNAQILLARIQKLLARTYEVQDNIVLTHKGLTLNLLKAEISYQGNKKSLTKNELGILRLLMVNKGNIIPRDAIIDELWQSEQFYRRKHIECQHRSVTESTDRNRSAGLSGNETWFRVLRMKLSEYLLDRIFSLICMLVAALVLLALLWLIETPAVFILFAEVILLAAYSTALLYDFFRKQSFYNLLQKMTEQMDIKTLLGELLVPPHFLEGQILVDVLRCCNKYQNDQLACAEQENREYREYLDSWVHEIKTPITSARLIVENEKNPTTLRIDDELRKIDAYVEQVLYYARSTDVEKDFKVEKTTLQALVYAALKTYSKPLIQVGGKPVLKELDIPVAADSKSCTFVIGQILSNAIKYRKDNLQVEFSARAEKNTVSLFISDNGIGISAADLPRVFDKGFTGENGRRYSKSTGIGLYLSQRLCRKMNISLSISSVPGQGTTVTMVFPTESYLQAAGL